MRTFRADGRDLSILQDLAHTLKRCNRELADAKKDADAAKEKLGLWLKENRSVDVASLPAGEVLQIEGVVLIEASEQRRFDEAGFRLSEPALHEAWTKARAVTKYKPLV